jgi:mechanosensitive ion channel-like protein
MAGLTAVDFGEGVSNAWRATATFVPKPLAFLVILFTGWLAGRTLGGPMRRPGGQAVAHGHDHDQQRRNPGGSQ